MKTIITLLIFITTLAQAEMRVWTNSKGQKIKAEISSATEDSVTVILKRNKKSYTFKMADMSEADQDYTKNWLKENAEALAKKKDEMFTFAGTKLVAEKHHQLTMTIDRSKYDKGFKFHKNQKENYTIGIMIPKDFDPASKEYTIIHVSVAGEGKPSKSIGAYKNLVKNGDCVLIGLDYVAYGSNMPNIDFYRLLERKWGVKSKKWPVAFYGFSGGAKASAYQMAQTVKFGYNVIGAYMSGCNEDRTAIAMKQFKLKSSSKKIYKHCAIWLSSGTKDKTATPGQHESVLKSMKKNRMKYVKIHSSERAHSIDPNDQVEALEWMKAQKR